MADPSIRYSDDFFRKASIYWHPAFPLLARTFENCHRATGGLRSLKPAAETFEDDARFFVEFARKNQPAYHQNREVDSLLLSSISELRSHLLILEEIDQLVDSFCSNCETNIKRNLAIDNIFGRSEIFSDLSSDSEDDDEWFDEITDGRVRRAKKIKLDTDWIRKYSNIIPDFMSSSGKNRTKAMQGPSDSASGFNRIPIKPVVQCSATEVFQSPIQQSIGSCTAFRSVEYVVWENETDNPSFLAPVPVPQHVAEYQKRKIRSQEIRNNRKLTWNPANVLENGLRSITPAPVKYTNENIEPSTSSSTAPSFVDYPNTMPTRETCYSVDATKPLSSSKPFVLSQSTMSAFTNPTNVGSALKYKNSTVHREVNGRYPGDDHQVKLAVEAVSGVSGTEAAVSPIIASTYETKSTVSSPDPVTPTPGSTTTMNSTSDQAPTMNSAFSAQISSINSDSTVPSQKMNSGFSDETSTLNSVSTVQAQTINSTSRALALEHSEFTDISNSTNALLPYGENTVNDTYASHYRPDATSDGFNSTEFVRQEAGSDIGQTFVVNNLDFTAEFAEGKTFGIETATGSSVGTTHGDSGAEFTGGDSVSLTPKVDYSNQLTTSKRKTKNNLHLLRPFSTPLVSSSCPKADCRSDPAEQEFVQNLVQRREPIPEENSHHPKKRGRPPGSGGKFPDESTAILKSWYDEHLSFPYPDRDQVSVLASATGLTKVQVRSWLSYKRRITLKAGNISSITEPEL